MTVASQPIVATKKTQTKKGKPIPAHLVYEELDGRPIYYRGWKNVVNKKQTAEEIMGYGDLQAILLTYIKDYLQGILLKNYLIIQGETGLHVEKGTNPSLDLCIYPKGSISIKNAVNKYLDIPPVAVIEVDTKADLADDPLTPGNYIHRKTEVLLNFGVQEVAWIFTNPEKVMTARSNQPWQTVGWSDEIELMGQRFSIQQIIDSCETDETA